MRVNAESMHCARVAIASYWYTKF